MRWLADVGRDLDDVVRCQFEKSFFSSTIPLVAGGLNSALIAGLAWVRIGAPLLIALALFDLGTIGLRLLAIHNAPRRAGFADLLFASSLAWCVSQALAMTIVLASKDMLLILIFAASTVATAAGIASRNFGAPRFALAQILILDLTFKVNMVLLDRALGIVAVMQGSFFLCINMGLIAGLRRLTIKALEGEAASRALAARDPLTGLANRRGLEDAYARRAGQVSAFAIDLDGFKQVNDRHGHAAGDVILAGVAARLREFCVGALSISRMGGDEFVVLVEQLRSEEREGLAARLVAILSAPYRLDEAQRALVGASVGVATAEAAPLEVLLRAADRALYAAKSAGKGRYILAESLPAECPASTADAGATRTAA
ncbi:GGDEF domain-containing protein [uncultured Sphingomonas sp.]|uniref:GGDEF domain-containing protein n=1 Tax=uncultured Sphingomonas sp. TaxID=158754 RepID=UPI0025D75E71|nr:GGDEF domain-containing protein [uncultured Sphingomonas sp.]